MRKNKIYSPSGKFAERAKKEITAYVREFFCDVSLQFQSYSVTVKTTSTTSKAMHMGAQSRVYKYPLYC